MPKRVVKLVTIPFDQWNKLHYLIVFLPIPIVITAVILAQIYL